MWKLADLDQTRRAVAPRQGRGLCVKSTEASDAEESDDLLKAKLGPTLDFSAGNLAVILL